MKVRTNMIQTDIKHFILFNGSVQSVRPSTDLCECKHFYFTCKFKNPTSEIGQSRVDGSVDIVALDLLTELSLLEPGQLIVY